MQPVHSALLIVDMQVGLFYAPQQPFEKARVLSNINQLIRRARTARVPILAVRHSGPEGSPIAIGAPFWQLLPELELAPQTDALFNKYRPSCFFETGLDERLAQAGIRELVVAGMKTDYCIDTTCRVASELGYKVQLAADAHTTMDSPHLSAPAIIEHHNHVLNGPFARVLKTADIRF